MRTGKSLVRNHFRLELCSGATTLLVAIACHSQRCLGGEFEKAPSSWKKSWVNSPVQRLRLRSELLCHLSYFPVYSWKDRGRTCNTSVGQGLNSFAWILLPTVGQYNGAIQKRATGASRFSSPCSLSKTVCQGAPPIFVF